MNGESLNIEQDHLAKLKEQFPNLFTEGKLDWEKLKATFSDDINFANERYVLNWAGKSDAFKVLQVPTTATLKPLPEESINFDTTENIFIEGENLEVLKVLQKSYYNKIKCISKSPPSASPKPLPASLKPMLPNKESLKTITQLETLVLIDKSENKLKDIAQLFVNAFRDWDTFNQTELLDFIKELLDFFGSPLTKEKIAGKQFDINKAWRHEAGNSIIEMIDISERFCNETDFQKIVETILTHYEKQLQNIDFIANLKYLTTEEGGRKTPVFAARNGIAVPFLTQRK